MRNRESGNRPDEPPVALDQNHQRQNEEQMVDADENVFYAEHDVRDRDSEEVRSLVDLEGRVIGRQSRDDLTPVEELNPHKDVGTCAG